MSASEVHDEEFVRELYEAFKEEVDEALVTMEEAYGKMEEAFARSNQEELKDAAKSLKDAAHGVKGSAAVMCLPALSEKAKDLELYLKNGGTDTESVSEKLAAFKVEQSGLTEKDFVEAAKSMG